MKFNSVKNLKKHGFKGFKPIGELFLDFSVKRKLPSSIPNVPGVYFVLYIGKGMPKFLKPGTAAWLGGESPNVGIPELEEDWITKTIVIYIGKAGGEDNEANLYKRIRQCVFYGYGLKYAHKGGCFIWQIENPDDLVICWRATRSKDPIAEEHKHIAQFKAIYDGNRPFANHRD